MYEQTHTKPAFNTAYATAFSPGLTPSKDNVLPFYEDQMPTTPLGWLEIWDL
jgi:hypothetical protein